VAQSIQYEYRPCSVCGHPTDNRVMCDACIDDLETMLDTHERKD
jgi:hypothetical protein